MDLLRRDFLATLAGVLPFAAIAPLSVAPLSVAPRPLARSGTPYEADDLRYGYPWRAGTEHDGKGTDTAHIVLDVRRLSRGDVPDVRYVPENTRAAAERLRDALNRAAAERGA